MSKRTLKLLLLFLLCSGIIFFTIAAVIIPRQTNDILSDKMPQPPISIILHPSNATNPVGITHTVIATVEENSQPMADQVLKFSVSGANTASVVAVTTDTNGQANFSYAGANTGEDIITVWIDDNNNNVRDSGEIYFDTASQTLTGPVVIYLPIIFRNHVPLPTCTSYHKDEFDISSSGWITGSYPNADYSYTTSPPYEYDISSKVQEPASSASPFGSFSEFTLKIKGRWANMPTGDEYGIIFGIKDKENKRVTEVMSMYGFTVDTEGPRQNFSLQKFDVNIDPTQWHPIVDWTQRNDLIKEDTSAHIFTNTLEVRCYGSWVSLFINEEFVWEGPVSNCGGEVGLITATFDATNNTSVLFDYFEICGVKEEIGTNQASQADKAHLVPSILPLPD